jgi:two-component system nitrogen regulation sensor histidine kinase NtrY
MLAFAFAASFALERPRLAAGALALRAAARRAAPVAAWALYELWRYIQRTNRELARFLEAVRLGDLSQSFAHRAEGSGFTEIGEALDQAIKEAARRAAPLTDASRFYEAVLDDAPTPC